MKTKRMKQTNSSLRAVTGGGLTLRALLPRLAALFLVILLAFTAVAFGVGANSNSTSINKIDVKLFWIDNENEAGHRPSFVDVTLLANGSPAVHTDGTAVDPIRLDAECLWTGSFTDLPSKIAGNDIEYTLSQANLNKPGEDVYTTDYEPTTLTWGSYTTEFDVFNTTDEGVLKGQLKITKLDDEDGSRLPGATFELTLNGSGKTYTGVTDSNGEYTFIVPLGTYTLRESKAPTGYLRDESNYTVKLLEGESGGVTKRLTSRAPLRAPATGTPVVDWTAFGNGLRWMIDSENKLILAPAEGASTGTVNPTSGEANWPWHAYRSQIELLEIESGVTLRSGGEFTFMFANCENMTHADVSGLDITGVVTLDEMFSGCTLLENIDGLESWSDGGTLKNVMRMFKGCSSLKEVDMSSVTFRNNSQLKLKSMFEECTSLTKVDLSGLTTTGSGNSHLFSSMFSKCENLISINIGAFTQGLNGTKFELDNFLNGCASLSTFGPTEGVIDLSGLYTMPSGSNLTNMFKGCVMAEELLIPNLDMSQISTTDGTTGIETMSSLRKIDVSGNSKVKSYFKAGIDKQLFLKDGMWKWSGTGDTEYNVRQVAELINGNDNGVGYFPRGVYTRTSEHAKGFEKIPQSDYVINNLSGDYTVTLPSGDSFEVYENNGSTFIYTKALTKSEWVAGSNANNEYEFSGPIKITYRDAATDGNGDTHDVEIVIDSIKITHTDTAVNKAKLDTFKRYLLTLTSSGGFELHNYSVTSAAASNPDLSDYSASNPGRSKLWSGNSGTYADVRVSIPDAKPGETFLFFVNDIDIHAGVASGSGAPYIEGSEGIKLGNGFELNSVATSDYTGLQRYAGFGSDFYLDPNGSYIIGSGSDGATCYSKFYARGNATSSEFTWTSGNSCDTQLFESEGAFVPVLFEKIDADTGERTPLVGAVLQVDSEDGSRMYHQWTSDGEKQGVFLMSGDYILKEAYAPNGRKISDSIRFKVLQDGRLAVNGVLQTSSGSGVSGTVTMYNRYAVTLEKTIYNRKLTTLTIRRPDGKDEQDFWYKVSDGTNTVEVCIPVGESSVTVSGIISGDTYTVTEMIDWSWRYKPEADVDPTSSPMHFYDPSKLVRLNNTTAKLTAVNDSSKNIVPYKGVRLDNSWLGGYDRKNNIFTLRTADPVTQENWVVDLPTNTEFTGRVWADKSVTTESSTTIGSLGYSTQTIEKTPDADFLVGFALLSSTVDEQIPGAIYSQGSPLQPNKGETSAFVTYTDPLGDYMTVAGMNGLVYGNSKYPVTKVSSGEDKDVYRASGSVVSDLDGNTYDLSDITIEVIHGTSLKNGDKVKVTVPDYLLPLRVFKVTDNAGTPQMSIDRTRPMHLFYSVDPKPQLKQNLRSQNWSDATDFAEWENYVNDPANQGKGGKTVRLYAGAWDPSDKTKGSAAVTFTPADDNHFAFFVNDTPIYDEDHNYCTEPDLSLVDLTKYHYHVYHYEFYDARLSTGELPQTGETYDARLVENTQGARYDLVDPNNITPTLTWDDVNGYWYIKSGALKENHRHTMESQKTDNTTETADSVFINDMDGDKLITEYLGNNGVAIFDYDLSSVARP